MADDGELESRAKAARNAIAITRMEGREPSAYAVDVMTRSRNACWQILHELGDIEKAD